MPKYIQSENIARMFPFEFYDELHQKFKDYVLLNPAFITQGEVKLTLDKRKSLFDNSRKNAPNTILSQNNILEIEPLGEVLALEPCCSAESVKIVLHDKTNRDQLPMSILIAQLYDSVGKPVFASEVSEDSIKAIPEVLWDDPNLLLAVISFLPEESRVAIIRIPSRIEALMFESVAESDSKNKKD